MDYFQYRLRTEKWKNLTTKKAKTSFIKEVFFSMDDYIAYGYSIPDRIAPEKQLTLPLRLLRNCFRTYDTNLLPDYIPATVFALIRK